ncbi:dihydroorotase [Thermococcus litoralis DSM 5473]|uniref:Dihydroorotase n=1 Tax=Thermococcus litoralis (strain ATCC 51850 / DSM 5473 / JCM 8560 / NS-C) TaxID=523849 RepID=H3ZLG4_THELN|nr:dihydroorotase [Thermococcus litoralis]EHR79219.1 dihydroorotase [Thermococcus litoralis DSM 5473]
MIIKGEIISKSFKGRGHIIIRNGVIKSVQREKPGEIDIDAEDKLVIPGLIDMHAHFREPGYEHRETIESGSRAAVHGGITTVALMPNTNPAMDNIKVIGYVKEKAREIGLVDVLPIGAITKGRNGKEITDFEKLAEHVVGFSDDGSTPQSFRVFLEATKYAKKVNKPILDHAEIKELSGGTMREGKFSRRYGISGIPDIAESIAVARDVEVARYTRAHIHIQHLSTKSSVDIVREGKKKGAPVSAEVTHHHLLFKDEDLKDRSSFKKVNPPLPREEDQEELIKGLLDGTIDIIVTDHAPYSLEEKNIDIEKAPFGISGIETLLSSLLLIAEKHEINFEILLEKVTYNPANLFNLPLRGDVREGYRADLVILDPDKEWKVTEKSLFSKGKNTPFLGRKLPGVVEMTIKGGRIVYRGITFD